MSSINDLEVLVGEWDLKGGFNSKEAAPQGRVTFEWMAGEQFLIERWEVSAPEAPDGEAIIGLDPESDGFLQHYFDSRGVARVYRMTLSDGLWNLWRDTADFSPLDFAQRFEGRISEDGRVISGAWEICHDGTTWEHDFELSYEKRSPG